MRFMGPTPHTLTRILALALLLGTAPWPVSAEPYCDWKSEGLSIPEPLCGLEGNPARGRTLAADLHKGNCLACHRLPIPEEDFHGTIGPPLLDIGSRLSPGEIRLRIVDEQHINPYTIMPPFYRRPDRLHQVAWSVEGRTFLTAREVEDLVAYLAGLRGARP